MKALEADFQGEGKWNNLSESELNRIRKTAEIQIREYKEILCSERGHEEIMRCLGGIHGLKQCLKFRTIDEFEARLGHLSRIRIDEIAKSSVEGVYLREYLGIGKHERTNQNKLNFLEGYIDRVKFVYAMILAAEIQ